jgi:peptidoglycan-associated lipoprotein
MKGLRLLLLGVGGLAATLSLAGCGPKRPHVLTGAERGSGSEGSGTESRGPLLPDTTVTSGPDVQPVDRAGTEGMDLPATADVTSETSPLEDIHFDFDQYVLTDEAKATLDKHAAWLKQRSGAKVTIEGHCDERGTTEYNLALGDKRARAAQEYLVSRGVAEGRLSAISLGKERPVDPGHGEAAWAKNRRAHFAVSR